jgi:cytochrome b involved in lipid metabolism
MSFSAETVATHNTLDSLWIIHNNQVYDVTKFALDHPGGAYMILGQGGKDVTEMMALSSNHVHSDEAYALLQDYRIGELKVKSSKCAQS